MHACLLTSLAVAEKHVLLCMLIQRESIDESRYLGLNGQLVSTLAFAIPEVEGEGFPWMRPYHDKCTNEGGREGETGIRCHHEFAQ